MKTRKKRILLLSIISPAFLAAALVIWFLVIETGETQAKSSELSMEIVTVEVLSSREGIEISGNIEPANASDLAFPIAGYIEQVYVDEGDYVEAGTVLAVLEDSQQRYNLAEVDVEIDTENVTGTRRNLDLLELKREMTLASLEDTRLSSTISGLVTSVDAEIGDYVTAQQAGSDKDIVVRIIDRSSMKATVEVDELDAPYLSTGQIVEFQFDAYPDLEVIGEVSMVPLEARETSQGIAVIDAEVIIADPPAEILPYFTFAGEIFLDEQEQILLIPAGSVVTRGERTMVMKIVSADETGSEQERPAGEGPDLQLPAGFTAVPVQVSVSEYSSGKVRVLKGLEAGDRVVVTSAGSGAVGVDDADEKGGTNVMELLGMPSGGTGGRPGGGPGAGPPPGGH
jgi:multidrug efflux pump subunit AcrA (membrane-fusion protein)